MICIQQHPPPLPVYDRAQSGKVEISRIVKPKNEEVSPSLPIAQPAARSASVPVTAAPTAIAEPTITSTTGTVPTKRQSANVTHPAESPAKKQSKWSPEEDTKIIGLRGEGMKWEDISKHLPGRSAISCRLHYQNYLERRSEWDEDRKNKLARLYERCVAQRGTRSCHTESPPLTRTRPQIQSRYVVQDCRGDVDTMAGGRSHALADGGGADGSSCRSHAFLHESQFWSSVCAIDDFTASISHEKQQCRA